MYRLYEFDGLRLPPATRNGFAFVGSGNVHSPVANVASGQFVDLLGDGRAERTRQNVSWECMVSARVLMSMAFPTVFPEDELRVLDYTRQLQRKVGVVGRLVRERRDGSRQWITARLVAMPLTPIGRKRQLLNMQFVTLEPYWWGMSQRVVSISTSANAPFMILPSMLMNYGDEWTPRVVLQVFRQPGAYSINRQFDFASSMDADYGMSWRLAFPDSWGNMTPRIDSLAHRVTSGSGTDRGEYLSYGSPLATTAHTSQYLVRIPPRSLGANHAFVVRAQAASVWQFTYWEAFI